MSHFNTEIREAIDKSDINYARELLRIALKRSDANSETYYLASQVADSEDEKHYYLNKANEIHIQNQYQTSGSDAQSIVESNYVEPSIPIPPPPPPHYQANQHHRDQMMIKSSTQVSKTKPSRRFITSGFFILLGIVVVIVTLYELNLSPTDLETTFWLGLILINGFAGILYGFGRLLNISSPTTTNKVKQNKVVRDREKSNAAIVAVGAATIGLIALKAYSDSKKTGTTSASSLQKQSPINVRKTSAGHINMPSSRSSKRQEKVISYGNPNSQASQMSHHDRARLDAASQHVMDGKD